MLWFSFVRYKLDSYWNRLVRLQSKRGGKKGKKRKEILPSNEKHPEAEVRALTVNKWVLVPSVDRGSTKSASCLAAEALIAQQAAISNTYFHLLGKKIAPSPVWRRLGPCAGRGCPGAATGTAHKAQLRRGRCEPQSTLRGLSHSAALPQASTGVKIPGFVPRRLIRRCSVANGNKTFRRAQTRRRKEKGVDATTPFTHRYPRAPLQCGAVVSIRLPDCKSIPLPYGRAADLTGLWIREQKRLARHCVILHWKPQ